MRKFLAHVLSEVGQEQFIARDLEALGYDLDQLEEGDPLPSTPGLLSYPAYALAQGKPMGQLGQIFFSKLMGTQTGESHRNIITGAGVPGEACSDPSRN